MTVIQAIILGIVQGITEFLPISSSAHLLIVPKIFGWTNIPESFEIALHFGTLLAIVIVFFKDWIELIFSGIMVALKKEIREEEKQKGKLFWYIFFSSIITAGIAFIFDKPRELLKSSPYLIYIMSFALIFMGITLYLVDKKKKSDVNLKNINKKQALMIGISQILALIPGMSRSGTTITTARYFGIERKDAAKFSFYLATPIIFAATILKIKEFVFSLPFFIGTLTSFLVGILVLKLFLKLLEKKSYRFWAFYRSILGVLLIILALFKIIS